MTNLIHGHASVINGRTPTYITWAAMHQRCVHNLINPATQKHYKTKGISITEEWYNFDNFLLDMGERPEGTTIDRIDGSKGYYASNCRWATAKDQAVNRKSTVFYTHKGKTQCSADWAVELGFTRSGFANRVKRLGLAKAIESKKEKLTMLTHAGRTQSLTDWANELGIKHITLSKRISRGWAINRALST